MKRGVWVGLIVILAIVCLSWLWPEGSDRGGGKGPVPGISQPAVVVTKPTAGEMLLQGYGDGNSPPIEDLRKIHRVLGGYFSVIKDPFRFPIGGNADLAAALRGENPNREIFIPGNHPVFSREGLLVDRWNTPLIVHPEGWRQIELRSAGEDRVPYTSDDLVILPTGMQPVR